MATTDMVTGAWRRALDVPYSRSLDAARRLRERHPDATPAELIAMENRRFTTRVSWESAAVGGVAAWPGIGTAVSAGASGAQLLAFVSEAAYHSMVVAHLHGMDLRDPAKRTALVVAALTGEEGAELISMQVGIQALSWFRSSFLNIRTVSAERFNKMMIRWVRRRALKSAAMSTVGRLIPFGIGAVVGWGIGSGLAKNTIEGLSLALGPAPESFAQAPTVVDVRLVDDTGRSQLYERIDLADEDADLPHFP
ncbi:VPDSG-CTERM exosortase interaction domain protein [Actinomyces sp. B33]|uniref:VPDSG-CTERM exosortase interaction domain protein n=1 Tax=Actinomyces sp. B33 TaxID=2942131 RepID=UPI0023411DB2|nr:VPDSG-CTERM exosortase interaction domain protein [Actinomyces sp. B33]MDC4233877.1 VPDSG-CTERM exosortase interaction domain protein [Actinomyces sp. B33]